MTVILHSEGVNNNLQLVHVLIATFLEEKAYIRVNVDTTPICVMLFSSTVTSDTETPAILGTMHSHMHCNTDCSPSAVGMTYIILRCCI